MKSMLRTTLLASMMLSATGCALLGKPIVRADFTPCSQLLPPELIADVDGSPEPPERAPAAPTAGFDVKYADALVRLKDIAAFGVAESAAREAANGRKNAALGVIQRCENRDLVAAGKRRSIVR